MIDLVLIIAEIAPIIIIVSGLFCSQWLLERLLSVTNIHWEENLELIMKISFFVGIFDFITLFCYIGKKIMGLNLLVIILLVVTGLVLTLRAFSTFEFAKWVALVTAGLCFIILWFANFLLAAIIFAPIVFLIIYLRLKFPEKIFQTVTNFVTNPIFATIIAILSIILGFLLLIFF